MADHIYIGSGDLAGLYIKIADHLCKEDFFALGLKVSEYGTSRYFEPVQAQYTVGETDTLTLLVGREKTEYHITNIYQSLHTDDNSLILILENGESLTLEQMPKGFIEPSA